jgi:hypothetical protein
VSLRRLIPVLLGALASAPAAAAAQPRVALVSLGADDAAALARLRPAVAAAGFQPVADEPLRGALEDPLADAPAPTVEIDQAGARLLTARAALARDPAAALDAAREAEALLRPLAPTPAVIDLLAQAALVAGQAQAARGDVARATASFRLARALAPGLTAAGLDARSAPLFGAAVAATASATLVVTTEPVGARVWVDGQDRGAAPVTLVLPVGDHLVCAVRAGYAGRGDRVTLEDGVRRELPLLLPRLAVGERALVLRRAARAAAEPELPGLAAEIADTAGAETVILVRADRAAVYDAGTGRLGSWLTGTDAVVAALPGRVDLTVRDLGVGPDPLAPPPARRPWYRTPVGVAALVGGGVLVAAVLVILLSPVGETTQMYDIQPPEWTP